MSNRSGFIGAAVSAVAFQLCFASVPGLPAGIPGGGLLSPIEVAAQVHDHGADQDDHAGAAHDDDHEMLMWHPFGGWTLAVMGQLVPMRSTGLDLPDGSPLAGSEFNLTQGAAMIQLESPDHRWSFRFTPHTEAWLLEDGERTPGGWGEGFIDSRHPHTFIHEAMVSRNHFDPAGTSWSVSAGKGFVPFGTDDPMSRPVVSYPTNHHLSQVLERFTVNAAVQRGPWIAEGAVFGGNEPEDPFDMSNWRSFGNSFGGRLTYRIEPAGAQPDEHHQDHGGHDDHGDHGAHGSGAMNHEAVQEAEGEPRGMVSSAPGVHGERPGLELSVSGAHIVEDHGGHHDETTRLIHSGARWISSLGTGQLYLLAEAAQSFNDTDLGGYRSIVAEAAWDRSRLRLYGRTEFATRPEYPREAGDEGYFRYDHDDAAIGITNWAIQSAGVEARLGTASLPMRPFAEFSWFRASHRSGEVDERLPLDRSFGTLTVGMRIFPGGGPMRMGPYGIRDDMTRMLREMH